MLKIRERKKAFTLVEIVITIVIIGILFVVLTGKFDYLGDKSKLSGVQTDFREFYHATKSAGYDKQLYMQSDKEFEDRLNTNLDHVLQFKDGVSAGKDPWNENYVYTTYRDAVNQTFYVMFASKGGRDRIVLNVENIIRASSEDDQYQVTMAFKQTQTDFRAIDSEDPIDAEIEKLLKTNLELQFGYYDEEPGLYSRYGEMLASWEQLTNEYGMNAEQDYSEENYGTDLTSPSHVIMFNATITQGTKLVIPNDVDRIGNNAFRDCINLRTIIILGDITDIGKGAFKNCTSLKSMVVPESVHGIGDEAFKGCNQLTKVIIQNGTKTVGNSAFADCTLLTDIKLPNSTTELGVGALQGCTNLRSVYLGGVTELSDALFLNCTKLEDITIPSGVKAIGVNTFGGCNNLTEVTFEDTTGWYVGNNVGARDSEVNYVELGIPSAAAKYLKETYAAKYWTK